MDGRGHPRKHKDLDDENVTIYEMQREAKTRPDATLTYFKQLPHVLDFRIAYWPLAREIRWVSERELLSWSCHVQRLWPPD